MQQPRPSPLALILNPPGPQQSTPGNTVELFVTVSNQGTQSAVIDVFIDETSRDLRQWCDAPRQRIALDPQQSTELAFRFQIPVQAFPGTYEYVLVVDAPQHYPEDTPIQRPRQLTLLPAVGGQRLQDPTFDLKPRTSALAPLVLKKGQSQPVQAEDPAELFEDLPVTEPLHVDPRDARGRVGQEGLHLARRREGLLGQVMRRVVHHPDHWLGRIVGDHEHPGRGAGDRPSFLLLSAVPGHARNLSCR